jgi:hypothetical protein
MQKTSDSALLMKQIGQTLQTSLGDAFMSLIDNAKSLRDILSDVLNQIARLFVEAGLRAKHCLALSLVLVVSLPTAAS